MTAQPGTLDAGVLHDVERGPVKSHEILSLNQMLPVEAELLADGLDRLRCVGTRRSLRTKWTRWLRANRTPSR